MEIVRNRIVLGMVIVLGVTAFSRLTLTGDRAFQAEAATAGNQPVHIDGDLPIEEELRQFREVIGGVPVTALSGGAGTLDELMERFFAGIEAEDRVALAALGMTVGEFAYLYYPNTRFTAPPYELPPGLVWFQIEGYGSRGLDRVLNRYGGQRLGPGYRCPDEVETLGEHKLLAGCVVEVADPVSGETSDVRLFGEILEAGGSFKFVTFSNSL